MLELGLAPARQMLGIIHSQPSLFLIFGFETSKAEAKGALSEVLSLAASGRSFLVAPGMGGEEQILAFPPSRCPAPVPENPEATRIPSSSGITPVEPATDSSAHRESLGGDQGHRDERNLL